MIHELQQQLAKTLGKLFSLACNRGYDCESFVRAYMNSEVARAYDSEYHFYQWCGESYLLGTLVEEAGGLPDAGETPQPDAEVMFWMGYTYSKWHHLTSEPSARIYQQADFKKMWLCYAGYHTLGVEQAIYRLKEE